MCDRLTPGGKLAESVVVRAILGHREGRGEQLVAEDAEHAEEFPGALAVLVVPVMEVGRGR